MQVVAFVLLVGSIRCGSSLTIGGHVQESYQPIFELWAESIEKGKPWQVVTKLKNYRGSEILADVTAMTTLGDDSYVDVLVCPFTTGASKRCINGVNRAYLGPVILWGAAGDEVFLGDDYCARLPNNNCVGMLTLNSKYFATGLAALDQTELFKNVCAITNKHPLSGTLMDGAKDLLDSLPNLELVGGFQVGIGDWYHVQMSVAKSEPTLDDLNAIQSLLEKASCDIVLIVGHNLDVEPVVIAVQSASAGRPKVIMASDGFTQLVNYGGDVEAAQCTLMPTQWPPETMDALTADADPVSGMTSQIFKDLIREKTGAAATYVEAAAYASMVAVENAMERGSKEDILANLKMMDVVSFYGRLNWDDKGIIQKPMYTLQLHQQGQVIVAPSPMSLTEFPCFRGDDENPTCREVRQAYKESRCCGNPGATFKMDGRRLSVQSDEPAAVLQLVRSALRTAEAQGGRAKAAKLSAKIRSVLDSQLGAAIRG
jgi:hypothetical protein